MTYEEALAFFAVHGHVSPRVSELRRARPTPEQLRAAVEVTVLNGQPRDLAEAAAIAILRGPE